MCSVVLLWPALHTLMHPYPYTHSHPRTHTHIDTPPTRPNTYSHTPILVYSYPVPAHAVRECPRLLQVMRMHTCKYHMNAYSSINPHSHTHSLTHLPTHTHTHFSDHADSSSQMVISTLAGTHTNASRLPTPRVCCWFKPCRYGRHTHATQNK